MKLKLGIARGRTCASVPPKKNGLGWISAWKCGHGWTWAPWMAILSSPERERRGGGGGSALLVVFFVAAAWARREGEERKGKEEREGGKEKEKKIQTRKFLGRKIKHNLLDWSKNLFL
jgi:hypothetical protein